MSEPVDLKAHLLAAGIAPTRQRLRLAGLLFRGPDRHVTAEQLLAECLAAGGSMALATIYNTLRTFSDAGLLREVVADANRTHYDTNVTRHHHFYGEDTRCLSDVADDRIALTRMPAPPDGMELIDYDVVIRVRRDA